MSDKKIKNKKPKISKDKKRRMISILLFAIWASVVALTLLIYRPTLGKLSSGNELCDKVIELDENTFLRANIPSTDGADGVSIKFATYRRSNSGNIYVTVTGKDSGKEYAKETIDVKTLQDNTFSTIQLNEKLNSKEDNEIVVHIKSNSKSGSAAGVYYSTEKCFEDSSFFIKNVNTEGDLTVRFLQDDADLHRFYLIIIIWVIVSFTIIAVLELFVKPKYEILFMVIALVFGLTFCVIMTPMSPPDETTHYEYSFQVSSILMGDKENHLVFNEEYQNYGSWGGHRNVSAAYVRLLNKINKPLSLRDTEVTMLFDIEENYKFAFLPQALGITLGRLLNWNMLRTFYLGRLFNLAFYVLCVFIAIKKTPIHKVLFGIIATTPIFMQQAGSYSYDAFVNGMSLITIAYTLKWMFEKDKVKIVDLIIVFIVDLWLAPCKAVYSCLSFLFWLVPANRFGGKLKKFLIVLVLTAPGIYQMVALVWPFAIKMVGDIKDMLAQAKEMTGVAIARIRGFMSPNLEGSEIPSFGDLIRNPKEAIMLFYRTIRYNIKNWFYDSVGRSLSGETLVLPITMVHILLGIIVMAAFRREDYVESPFLKAMMVFVCIVLGFGFMLGMLLAWTEDNRDMMLESELGLMVNGVQGRYFSPLLPYFFSILNNKKIGLPKESDKYLLSAQLILIFEIVVYVLSYTFVN